jgi:chromosome partitioning protein
MGCVGIVRVRDESGVMATTISLLNMKGGVGKTTLAVNLAWHFYHHEKKAVLLVDLDPQFNATQYVMDFANFAKHRTNAGTIADLFIDQPRLELRVKKLKADPSAALYQVKVDGAAKLDLLPSELDLGWVVKNPAQMEYRLEKVLCSLRPKYDYIFIDCAPTDSVLTTMALTASDYVVVPIRPDRFSILGFQNLAKTIDDFRANCNDEHHVKTLGIVFTQVTGTTPVEADCMAQIRLIAKKQKDYVFTAALRYSNSFTRAVKDQTPIFQTAYAQADVRNAAKDIADEMKARIASFTP